MRTTRFVLCLSAASACAAEEEAVTATGPALTSALASTGSEVKGTTPPFLGIELRVPAGSVADGTQVTITPAEGDPTRPALPATAAQIGAPFRVAFGAPPKVPVELSLPSDLRSAAAMGQDYRQVKVWRLADGATSWSKLEALDSLEGDASVGSVLVEASGGGVFAAGVVSDPEPCDECSGRALEGADLPSPAIGTWLDCDQTSCAVLVASERGVAAAIAESGAPARLTAPLSADAASRLWPARGLCLADGGRVVVALADRVAVLDEGGAVEHLGGVLAVHRTAAGVVTAVDRDGSLHLETRDAAWTLVDSRDTTLATPPWVSLAGDATLVVGATVDVLLGEERVKLPNTRVLSVSDQGLALDVLGRVRDEQGLPMEGKLAGVKLRAVTAMGPDRLAGLDLATGAVWLVTSNYEPPTPAHPDRFEASEVEAVSLTLDGEGVTVRAMDAVGERLWVLTQKGRLASLDAAAR